MFFIFSNVFLKFIPDIEEANTIVNIITNTMAFALDHIAVVSGDSIGGIGAIGADAIGADAIDADAIDADAIDAIGSIYCILSYS